MVDLHAPSDWLRLIGRNSKRLITFVLGAAVFIAGLLMLVLPGPGILVSILGLVILAREFVWAERILDRTTDTAAAATAKLQDSRTGKGALAASGVGMIVGGIAIAVVFSGLVVMGISIAVAGVIALCTLLPQVQDWIAAKSSPPGESIQSD